MLWRRRHHRTKGSPKNKFRFSARHQRRWPAALRAGEKPNLFLGRALRALIEGLTSQGIIAGVQTATGERRQGRRSVEKLKL